MNGSLTLCLEVIFWFALFVVFYTYLGYGIVLYILVKLKELFVKPVKYPLPASNDELPEVTLFITAFNEEDVVDEKMENSLELDYPADKLRIVWVMTERTSVCKLAGQERQRCTSNRYGKARRLP